MRETALNGGGTLVSGPLPKSLGESRLLDLHVDLVPDAYPGGPVVEDAHRQLAVLVETRAGVVHQDAVEDAPALVPLGHHPVRLELGQ